MKDGCGWDGSSGDWSVGVWDYDGGARRLAGSGQEVGYAHSL